MVTERLTNMFGKFQWLMQSFLLNRTRLPGAKKQMIKYQRIIAFQCKLFYLLYPDCAAFRTVCRPTSIFVRSLCHGYEASNKTLSRKLWIALKLSYEEGLFRTIYCLPYKELPLLLPGLASSRSLDHMCFQPLRSIGVVNVLDLIWIVILKIRS